MVEVSASALGHRKWGWPSADAIFQNQDKKT